MKRIATISLVLLTAIASTAQITITVDDLLDVGDSVNLASVDSVPAGFNPGPDGPNQHWDFSNLMMDTINVLKFIDPSTTPYGNEFPASNIAVEGLVDDLGIEGFAYGTRNMAMFRIDGAAGSYDIFEDIVVPFNPPEVMFDFPVNYKDSLLQTTVIDITLDSPEPAADSIRVKISSTVDSRVDGWGEVTTPVWTGQALRFRDVRTTIDSSWVKIVFFWIFLEANENISITYKYMANDIGYPVLQFNADTSETEFSAVNYHFDAGTGEAELPMLDQLSFEVFPNPANDIMYCKFEDAFEGVVIVYDMTGRQFYQRPVARNQQQFSIDVSDYPAGMYQVVFKGNGQLSSAKKVLIY